MQTKGVFNNKRAMAKGKKGVQVGKGYIIKIYVEEDIYYIMLLVIYIYKEYIIKMMKIYYIIIWDIYMTYIHDKMTYGRCYYIHMMIYI